MSLVLVAAIGENNVIGAKGKLPWHLRSDLRHFRALTLDKPVIMGRKTFQSIGKALDRRTNIVISSDKKFAPKGVTVAPSFKAAMEIAEKDAKRRGIDEIMVIGGQAVFADAMPLADRLEITHVRLSPKAMRIFRRSISSIGASKNAKSARPGPETMRALPCATYIRR